jgi:hypothetical protein
MLPMDAGMMTNVTMNGMSIRKKLHGASRTMPYAMSIGLPRRMNPQLENQSASVNLWAWIASARRGHVKRKDDSPERYRPPYIKMPVEKAIITIKAEKNVLNSNDMTSACIESMKLNAS